RPGCSRSCAACRGGSAPPCGPRSRCSSRGGPVRRRPEAASACSPCSGFAPVDLDPGAGLGVGAGAGGLEAFASAEQPLLAARRERLTALPETQRLLERGTAL